MGSGARSKYASAFSAVPEGRLYLQASGTSCNRPRHRRAGGEAARSSPRTVIRWNPKRLWRILFFSLGPITVILKSLQIRLQRSER
jgi:hypothetical protein